MIGFVATKKLQEKGIEGFMRLDFEVNSQAMRIHRHSGK